MLRFLWRVGQRGCVVVLEDEESIGRADPGVALCDVLSAFRLEHAGKRLADIAVATLDIVLFSPPQHDDVELGVVLIDGGQWFPQLWAISVGGN
jgi:hypothetical protein